MFVRLKPRIQLYQQVCTLRFCSTQGVPSLDAYNQVLRRSITAKNDSNTKAAKKVHKTRPRRRVKFIDSIRLSAVGGTGGKGSVSFKNRKNGKPGKPDGGDGGKGGDVIIRASRSKTTLLQDTFHVRGGNGSNGTSNQMIGRGGKDAIIHVPLGTVVMFKQTKEKSLEEVERTSWNDFFGAPDNTVPAMIENEECEDDDNQLFAEIEREIEEELGGSTVKTVDLIHENDSVIIAKGGKGGRGSMTNRLIHRKQKIRAMKGDFGEKFEVELELKMIADVGFVGYPNAGKSTLLSAISQAKPEIASYPFTTLSPMIGVVRSDDVQDTKQRHDDAGKIIFADIPGLVEGAHMNKGLGHAFLRHVERTKILVYVIDIAGSEGRDPVSDFLVLQKELLLYRPKNRNSLADKPCLVLANKSDLENEENVVQENFKRLCEVSTYPTYLISGKERKGTEDFVGEIKRMVEEMKCEDAVEVSFDDHEHIDLEEAEEVFVENTMTV